MLTQCCADRVLAHLDDKAISFWHVDLAISAFVVYDFILHMIQLEKNQQRQKHSLHLVLAFLFK